jgi:DNA polymerase-3 subunit gamma/tau
MNYQVLARKWRPKNFSELVGQDAAVRTLTNALDQSRLHHAYLFTGTRGVGKTTIARIFAKCLSCEAGITATPCNTCNTCQAIDKGQFVDLIEVDAASRTKVEDTRDLLDNVQYAPTQGRFKIYLIDEVHMLSTHSFNALLKTLEEPPAHVKFLLATTDPQKLPVTVLSRCLQFHLRGITVEVIAQQLRHILTQEKINFTDGALEQIATAANGSLRDALSILDQAISFSGGNITDATTRDLLGATAYQDLFALLTTLAGNNAETLFQQIETMALNGLHFPQVLLDLQNVLQQIAWLQQAPTLLAKDLNYTMLSHFAELFSAEDIQLFYQIALTGQRDLPYAATPRIGFGMTLLRMLSFVPVTAAPISSTTPPSTSTKRITPAVQKNPEKSGDWNTMIGKMNLVGITKLLAEHCALVHYSPEQIQLQLAPQHASFANDKQKAQLTAALQQHYGAALQVKIEIVTPTIESPAAQNQRQTSAALETAKNTLISDPHVQTILQDFGGFLDEKSIKLTKQ